MRRILLLLITVAFSAISYGQCTVTAFPESLTFNCDDSVQVNFSAFADFALNNDFNLGVAGAGWQATSSAQFNNPYDVNDGTTYLWMGDQADVPRALTSNPLDLSLGGLICFDLAYAVQGNASPVEGPDESDEGVSLQYSTDGGLTWVDIAYFQPDGTILPTNPGNGGPGATGMTPFTSWGNYCFPIPAGAFGGMTQIQWIQEQSSTANFDHWGLDNIEVFVADTTYNIVNLNTGVSLDSTVDYIYGTTDTTYNWIYTNGIDDTCITSADFTLNPTDAGPDIIAACDGIGVPINVTGVSPWSVVSWSPSAGLDDAASPNPFANPIDDTEYIVTSNCGEDTILVDVVPTFDVSILPPDSICIGGFATLETETTPDSVSISSFIWTPAATLNTNSGATVLASPNTTTTYTVTATSDANCVRQATTTVNVSSDAIFLNLVNDSALICAGDTVSASVNVASPNPGVPYILIPTPYETMVPTGPVLPIVYTSGEGISNITLPFAFEYFGNPVTQGSLSSNGWFSFSPAFNADNTADAIPTVTGVDNMIALAWDDLDPSAGGTVSAYILGSAPNQAFVIEFIDVPFEGDFETVSVQIVLYEGSNIIQFNVIDIENSGLGMNMTMGIENFVGTSGLTLPNRNATDFAASMESWQFIPYNAPLGVTFAWDPSPFLDYVTTTDVLLYPEVDSYFPVSATTSLCTAIDSIYVNVDEFVALANPDTFVCAGVPFQLSAEVEGTPDSCSYVLDMFDSFGDGWNGASLTVVSGGENYGPYTVDNVGAGVFATATFTVAAGEMLELIYVGGTFDNEVTFTLFNDRGEVVYQGGPNPIDGVVFATISCEADYTYAWTPGPVLDNSSLQEPTATITNSTEFIVTITNSNGCAYSDTTNLTITQGMVGADQTICEGDTAPLVASGAGAYLWSPNDGSVADVNAPVTVAYPTTTTTYTMTFNPILCPTTETVLVTVNPAPTVTINNGVNPAEFCEGTSVDLVAAPNNAAWSYDWTGPEQGSGSTFNVSTAGPYVIFFTDDNNCTNFANINVVENVNPTLDFTSLRNVLCCTDDEVFIDFDATTVTNGETITSFTLNGNAETAPFSVVSGTGTQTFAVVATSDNGCEGLATIDIVTNCIQPTIADIPELFVDAPANFDLSTLNSTFYTWGVTPTGMGTYTDGSIEDPEYTGTVDGDFTAYVDVEAVYLLNDSSEYSCFETDSAAFFVTSIAPAMLPDAFTPNGDGDNDIFFDVTTLPTNNTINFFRIYNRWGTIVYNYEGAGNGWDGNFQGNLQPNDNYRYEILIDKADGTQEQFQGGVALIR